MSKYNKNPYRSGKQNSFTKIFGYWQNHQIVTRKELEDFAMSIGRDAKNAEWDVRTILSPRKSSKRGDARGSVNSWGHLYYAEKSGRSVKLGVKEPQKFRLRWRNPELQPRTRETKDEVKQVTEAKMAVKVANKVANKETVKA